MGLRWKIALALAVVAAAATIAVGVLSYRATSNRLSEEVDRSLAEAIVTIGPGYRDAARNRGVLPVFTVQLLDRSGRILVSDHPVRPGPGAEAVVGRPGEQRYETMDTDEGDVRALTVGALTGPFGGVQVMRSLEENERVLTDLRRRTIALVAVVTAAAALVGWLLARTVTGPLVRLTRVATDVEQSGRLDVGIPVSGRDEVGRLGTAFDGMLNALATSRADQQRLVQDAGHELRTPLTSLRTNLAVLRRHPDLDPETRRKVLDELHAEVEELVVLVEEVVALAQGSVDDTPPTRIELGLLARTVAERAERRHGRPVLVTADQSAVEAPLPSVERAMSNLVDNAAKFDPSGGPIEVVVDAGAVTVLDRGPGIPAGDEDRVFDRFYRAEGARTRPGSGLGLSIVRDVATRNGGSVIAAPRPGGGAVVGFRLPVSP
jgi:two-component system, OmpR family, sensor histidine kinase MprB